MTQEDDLRTVLEQSRDIDDLYAALIRAGKEKLVGLRDVVQPLLQHQDPEIRGGALQTLAFFWRLPEYRESIFDYVKDVDPSVRSWALHAWAGYRAGTRDRDSIGRLWIILRNDDEDIDVRQSAFLGMLTIYGVSSEEYWKSIYADLKNDRSVAWERIRAVLGDVGLNPPEAVG